nr:T9SS type A sorting domain-containing protein [Chitinophagaceae bacterium]
VSGAAISWTALGGALNYDVDYKLASGSTWTNAATATTATSVNLSGLTENSLYDWRVRANCTGATGTYSTAQFTTLSSTPTCGTVSGLTSSGITTAAATVSWTTLSGALNYDVDYKTNASATWINAATGTTSTSVSLSGLAAGTLYDWRVRANCTGATGAYTQAQFTTTAAVTCPGPYDVSTNGTASGAATIPFNTDVKGLINPSGDNDYYRFVITTGGTATITLTTLPANYNIRLYSSNGTTLLASSTRNGTNTETISRTYTAGTYFVRVNGSNSNAFNATNCYTLRVALGTASSPEGGIMEPVNEKPVLALFPNPVRQQLTLYVANYDKQKVVEIYNISGQRVMRLNAMDNAMTLDVSKLKSGMYLLRVSSTEGRLISQEKFIHE